METQVVQSETRQQIRLKERQTKKQERRKKTLVSEVQKGRVVGGLGYQQHITQSFADYGLIDAQDVRVYSHKHYTNFNVDSQVRGLLWNNGVEYNTFGEIKQSLKGEGVIKVHVIADTFKEEYPDCKYGIFYKDGCIPKGDYEKLKKYPNIDFVVPESKMSEFLSDPHGYYHYTEFDETIVDEEVWQKLKTYDQSLTDDMLNSVISSIDLVDKIKIIEAPTGFGKTHFSVHTLVPYFLDIFKVKIVAFVAPQVALLSKRKLRTPGLVDYQIESELPEAKRMVKDGCRVIVPMSDDKFRTRGGAEWLVKTSKELGLDNQILLIRDEGHYSGSSKIDTVEGNTGSNPTKYLGTMFKAINKVMKVTPYVYYLTATPVKEQLEEMFGTDMYHLINDYPSIDKLFLRTAKLDKITFFPKLTGDEGRDINKGSVILNNFVEALYTKEKQIHTFVDLCDIDTDDFLTMGDNHPLKKKLSGIIKLETKYKDKVKLSDESLDNMFKMANIQRNFNYCISVANEYRLRKVENGKVTEIPCDFQVEDDVYDALDDKNNPLKFYCVIDKGSMGVDIPSLHGLLSFRTPGTEFEGKPVIVQGEQLFGRLARLHVLIEDLYQYNWKSKDDMIKYYCMMNSFDVFCEDLEYWRDTHKSYLLKQGSIDDTRRHLIEEL